VNRLSVQAKCAVLYHLISDLLLLAIVQTVADNRRKPGKRTEEMICGAFVVWRWLVKVAVVEETWMVTEANNAKTATIAKVCGATLIGHTQGNSHLLLSLAARCFPAAVHDNKLSQ
jgi:hypothetical protein